MHATHTNSNFSRTFGALSKKTLFCSPSPSSSSSPPHHLTPSTCLLVQPLEWCVSFIHLDRPRKKTPFTVHQPLPPLFILPHTRTSPTSHNTPPPMRTNGSQLLLLRLPWWWLLILLFASSVSGSSSSTDDVYVEGLSKCDASQPLDIVWLINSAGASSQTSFQSVQFTAAEMLQKVSSLGRTDVR